MTQIKTHKQNGKYVNYRYDSTYLVEQVLLGHKVFLEHVLVEVVGRADAPLNTSARHLKQQASSHQRVSETAKRYRFAR